MHLTIIKNRETIDHREMGISLVSFRKSSISHTNQYETVEGRHGLISLGTTYGGRRLMSSFFIKSDDHIEYQSIKDEVYKLFATEEEMILIDSRQPEKQWIVKVENDFDIENVGERFGKFEVSFISSTPFAESVKNTLDPSMFSAQLTGTGTRIAQYKHTTTTFDIFNGGDVKIDPRVMPLTITYSGSSSKLRIINLTTGEEWSCGVTTNTGDKIVLDGVRSTKNGLSIFRDTNKRLITLAPGWNEFKLTGTSGTFDISFDFKFYTF